MKPFSQVIIDIETNGLLLNTDRLHCIVILDINSGEMLSLQEEDIHKALSCLRNTEKIIGHNILSFDLPILERLFNFKPSEHTEIFDTLVASRLIWSDLKNDDFTLIRKGSSFPSKLIGFHSLKAWGFRLGILKDDFGETTDWSYWSPEMQSYCEQDTRVTLKLYELIQSQNYSPEALSLEHQFRAVIDKQEAFGFCFNKEKAIELYGTLQEKRLKLKEELQTIFPPIDEGDYFTPKVNNKTRGYVKGVEIWRPKITSFNPSSRQHIASRLKDKYNWQPAELTEQGVPKVDEEVLSSLPYPEAKLLSEYLLLDKRLGQLSDGQQAWLKAVDGITDRIHGRVNTNGTVTGRCTHHSPNMAQVPAVGAPYGKECRSLFGPPKGYYQIGCDASGLELRCLAHYLARYDGGAYAQVVLHGDIHTTNQKAAGLPDRNTAKRFAYAYLYGAGDLLIGSLINPTLQDDPSKIELGKEVKARFLKQTPALAMLLDDIQKAVKARGYLIGLDKRRLPIRSVHSALNTLLQSAGAIAMKLATCLFWETAEMAMSWRFGDEVAQMAHIHDEFQLAVRDDIPSETVGNLAVKAIQDAGKAFNFRCPLDGEYKVGTDWAETH